MDIIPPQRKQTETKKPDDIKSISLNAQTPELIQALYHEITNKTEKIQDIYEDNLDISYANLAELNRFIEQTFKPYDIQKPSVRVRVSLEGGENLQFSSFERFSIAQTSTTKPITNLNIKYSFLLSTATQKSDTKIEHDYSAYEVEVTFMPSIHEDKKLNGIPSGFRMFLLSSSPTLVAEIVYVDFAVARSFQAAIKSWIETVKVSQQNLLLLHLKRHSPSYFRALKIIGIAVGFLIIYFIIPEYNLNSQDDLRMFSIWVLISCALILFIFGIVKLFEKFHERYILPMNKYCVLRVTSGDKENAKKIITAYKETPKKIFKTLLGALFAIILNIIAAYVFSKVLN